MSAYIVSDGALLRIGCPSTLDRETTQQAAFATTLAGVRKAFIRRGGRRSWTIQVDAASPGEVSTIETIARQMGEFGWYPAEAVVGNLLSPQATAFDVTPMRAGDAGLVQLPDGTVAHAISRAETGLIYVGGQTDTASVETVPVQAGGQVTVGAWATGTFRADMLWRDATGGAQSSSTGTTTAGGDEFTWREQTFTVPPGKAVAGMSLATSTLVARPSIAWGATARDELGNGCPHAIIHQPSYSSSSLWVGGNWTDSTYRVTEVG